eukprot:365145-Chlamydomonas_euryale.AAC.26
MDQTGSARSYPTSTIARCGKERKAQGPETFSKPDYTGEGRRNGVTVLLQPLRQIPSNTDS